MSSFNLLRSRRPEMVVSILAVLLGVRALVVFGQFVLHLGTVQRFHVETAFVWFVLVGVLAVAVRGNVEEGPADPAAATRLRSLALTCALAVVLYRPALSVGFLSDDFTLLARAEHWRLGAVHSALFRPLPMLLWSAMESAGLPAAGFHLLNVLLHGTNAWLSGIVIGGWTRRRGAGELGALLVLAAPVAVEAVAWCSGLFDVLMTTFALATVLILRAYEVSRSSRLLVAAVATTVAAILCKETGVVVPALVVCDAIARRSREYRRNVAVPLIGAIAVVYAAARVGLALTEPAPAVTKYVVQRTIFQAFGALADPWRGDVLQAMPALVLVHVLIVAGLLVRFVVAARSRASLRVPLAACVWILASVAPVGAILWIPADLQASRYLYLAACAWSGLVASLAWNSAGIAPFQQRLRLGVLLVLAALSMYSTRQNLRPWTEAAAARDRVMAAAGADPVIRGCTSIAVTDVPDHVRGAYVFRNGVGEAFRRELGIVVDGPVPSHCAFRWEDGPGRFAAVSARAVSDAR